MLSCIFPMVYFVLFVVSIECQNKLECRASLLYYCKRYQATALWCHRKTRGKWKKVKIVRRCAKISFRVFPYFSNMPLNFHCFSKYCWDSPAKTTCYLGNLSLSLNYIFSIHAHLFSLGVDESIWGSEKNLRAFTTQAYNKT